MAIVGSRDDSTTEAQLAAFLTATVPGMTDVSVTVLPSPSSTGFSGDTVLFDATYGESAARRTAELVARVAPRGYSLYQHHDLETQWRVIDAVGRFSDVPVPRIVAHDTTEASALGAPFFVMERVEGSAPADRPPYTVKGWLHDATADEQAAAYRSGLDILARIHRLDWRRAGLEFLTESTFNPVGVERQFQHDRQFMEWAVAGRNYPALTRARDWMATNMPAEPTVVLSWGDSRLGNLLFRDMRPVAVLDWEMVTLAAPAADVGWWLVFNQIHSVGIARPGLPGIPDDRAALELYRELSGLPATDAEIHFYMVRAAVRAALLLIKYGDALIAAGTMAADAARLPHTPAMVVLDNLLETGALAG